MVHPLVIKFENVKIKHTSLLPPEDVAYCKQQQQYFDETLAQLTGWQTFFNDKLQTENNPAFKITDRYRTGDEKYVEEVYKYAYRMAPDANIYDKFKFSVTFNVVAIAKLITKAKLYFPGTIYTYFEEKYSIKLKRPDGKDQRDFTKYETIIDDIRLQLGGSFDFRYIAIEEAIGKFQKMVQYRKPELKGRTVVLDRYMCYGYSTYSVYDRSYFDRLNDVTSIFEKEEVIPFFFFQERHYSGEVTFDSDYVGINCSRIEGIRLYKNQKVIIKFTDAQAARDFLNRFQLTT